MKTETAVKWLINCLPNIEDKEYLKAISNEALKKEKEKMKEVWNASYKEMHNSFSNDYYKQKTFEQYFEETFKN